MRYLLFIFLALWCSCTNRQEAQADDAAKNDTIERLLSRKTGSTDMSANDKAFSLIKNSPNFPSTRDNLVRVVENYSTLNEWPKLQRANKLLTKLAVQSNDTIALASSYYFAGNRTLNEDKIDSAYYYYLNAERLLVKKGENTIIANVYLNKSTVQLIINDFLGAEFSASQALKFYRLNENILGQYDAYTNLGIASNGNENYQNAIQYYKKALQLSVDHKINPDYYLSEISINNIGNAFLSLKKYNESIAAFEDALRNPKIKKDRPSLYATLLDNLAYAKFKRNDKDNLEGLFLRSLEIRDSMELSSKIIYTKIHLSEYYHAKRDTIKAQRNAREALQLARKINTSEDLLRSLKQLSAVEHKNSSQYSKQYIEISDSLKLEERKSKDKFARIAFETDEILMEKDKLAEQNRNLLYFFVITLLIGLLLFVIRNQRAKNRELMLIQAQQKANEEIYNLMITQQSTIEESRVREKKRIAQELHDGILGRLFGARLNLDSLNRSADDDAIAARYNYLNELKNIEQDIREISHDLNREKYALINNFAAILNNLVEEQKAAHTPDVECRIDRKVEWDMISNNAKINLYRIVQESFQNINKYAKANRVRLDIRKNDESLIMTVSDDGQGFETSTRKKGIGLQNMESRVKECNGTLDVKSKKGKGTTISVSIPLKDNMKSQ